MTRRTSAVASLVAVAALAAACSGDGAADGATTTVRDRSTPATSTTDATVTGATGATGSTTASPPPSTTAGTTGPANDGGGRGSRFAFRDFDSCGDFLEWTKAEMLERVTPYGLDDGYHPPWAERAVDVDDRATDDTTSGGDGSAPMPDAEAPATTVAASGATSTTNTQEAGVDEGDLTETDGRYVYSVLDDRLRSVDLDTQTLISEIELRPGDHQLILFGPRLLVVSQDWTSGVGETIAARYAVADGALTPEGASHLEGQLVAVRSIDGVARIVMQQPLATRLAFVRPRTGGDDEQREALEENRRIIEEATAEQLLPRRYRREPNGSATAAEPAIACDQVGAPEEFSGFDIVWVAIADLHDPQVQPFGAAGVVATARSTYASSTGLYVSTTVHADFTGDTVPVRPEPPSTHVLAFDLAAPDGADYLASGEVDGELLNQYSMSEHDGFLRVATTTWAGGFGDSQESGVHILRREGEVLVEVGSVTGLAPGEQIQAVRFLGDIGYVVTFRQVDPLFVLDLSDPTAPALRGELKVPGYSTYLHPVGDDRLLAIGFAGDEAGLSGDMQLSLFDVSDLTNPTLLSTLPLVGWSEAAFDPHGFLYWPATGQVIVPKELLCLQHIFDCTSAVVARIEGDRLTEQGRLFSWWPIRRSMIADGDLVTVSSIGTKIWSLDTLDALADIRFDVPGTARDEALG